MSYVPSEEILNAYANVLVNFALGGGKGIKKGDVVLIQLPEAAKPLYVPLRDAVLRAGGNPIMQYRADGVEAAHVYELSSPEQLAFFPSAYYKGLSEQIDHRMAILADADKYELSKVEPGKIMAKSNTLKPYQEWLNQKQAAGKYTWTVAMYGTPAMAADVGMSEEEYWLEIIKACYLDAPDPVAAWKRVQVELDRIRTTLDGLAIDTLRVEGEGIDLTVGLGEGRHWLAGSGANIPSFEVFTSPDWRRTNGVIHFNQPLFRYGNKIEGIKLRFVDGIVTEASAVEGEALLKEMLASENANKIGEFSLTDGRHSNITRPMGETLYDENMGGPEGNTHIAVGNAYQDTYPGDASSVSAQEWDRLSYNKSAVHTDIISTERRRVTATLPDGSQKVIYENGRFLI